MGPIETALRQCPNGDDAAIFEWLWRDLRYMPAFELVCKVISKLRTEVAETEDQRLTHTDWAARERVFPDVMSEAIEMAELEGL